MVLFIVTIVIAMLTLAVIALATLSSREYEATRLRGDEIQAGQLVQSGIEYIIQMIKRPQNASPVADEGIADALHFTNVASTDPLYDNPAGFRNVEVIPAITGRAGRGAGRFTVFSPKIERTGIVGIRYGLFNESNCLHLGTILEWEEETPGAGAGALLKLPGMTPSIRDSIIDWIDANKTPLRSGAERDYYERSGVPYRPRNAIPVSLKELLLVRDMTRLLLYGDVQRLDEYFQQARLAQPTIGLLEIEPLTEAPLSMPSLFPDFPTAATDNESEAVLPTETTSIPWCWLLTVHSAEKIVNPDDEPKIFLNEDDLDFLSQQLQRRLDDESVQFIVSWRKTKGTIDDPVDLLDATVTQNASETTTAPPSNVELKSPFSFNDPIREERFLRLLDYATSIPDIVIDGRINVNEAPRLVLEAVPELNQQLVSQILARRGMQSERKQGRFRHAVWLLAEKIVDLETMKKLSKRLTTGGDVYRATVVGHYDVLGIKTQQEVVIDATVKPARVLVSNE